MVDHQSDGENWLELLWEVEERDYIEIDVLFTHLKS